MKVIYLSKVVSFVVQILFLVSCAKAHSENAPEVQIEQGALRGYYRKSWKERTFNAFTGIPYAEPPIGDLRFKASIPAGPWTGTLEASKPHSICPQMNILFVKDLNVQGDENCLYLNVYTPQLPSSEVKLLPVMFFIHGGGFTYGYANHGLYGPDILMDRNVVLVTANYRLGALGFLSTGDSLVPGNNGLKDQNLALRWTKKNIARFGGDPDQITIFGQSAGAASTHYHVLSPLSKDLIKGAIIHSGSAIAPWALGSKERTSRNVHKLANLLNCSTSSTQEMVDCLKKVNAYDIVAQDPNFPIWSSDPVVTFRPVIEPDFEGAFLPEDPIDIIKSDKAAQIPIIAGFNTEDGAIKSPGLFVNDLITTLDKEFNRIAPITLLYDETVSDADEISAHVRKHYFDNRKIDNTTKFEVTQLYTDAWFLSPVDNLFRLHWKYTKQPLFYYLFGYRGSVSFTDVLEDPSYDYGVCHADELIYLFNSPEIYPNYKPNKDDQKMTDIMTTLWSNFAKTGTPAPETNYLIPTKWDPIHSEKLEYYFIKGPDDIKMAEDLYPDRVKLWRDVAFSPRWNKLSQFKIY